MMNFLHFILNLFNLLIINICWILLRLVIFLSHWILSVYLVNQPVVQLGAGNVGRSFVAVGLLLVLVLLGETVVLDEFVAQVVGCAAERLLQCFAQLSTAGQFCLDWVCCGFGRDRHLTFFFVFAVVVLFDATGAAGRLAVAHDHHR